MKKKKILLNTLFNLRQNSLASVQPLLDYMIYSRVCVCLCEEITLMILQVQPSQTEKSAKCLLAWQVIASL